MNKLKSKVMVTTLAAVMLFGGAQVLASENDTPEVVPGSEVYSESMIIPARRNTTTTRSTVDEFTAPVSGQYYFEVDGRKVNSGTSTSIRTSFSIDGQDSSDSAGSSSLVVYLEAGQVYPIEWEARSRFAGAIQMRGTVLAVDGYYQQVVEVPEAAPAPVTFESEDARALSVRNFVEGLYVDVLGRQADAEGTNEWVDKIMTGSVTGIDITEQMFSSSEFASRDLSDEEFIEVLFTVFGTDVYDEDAVMNDLFNGMSRSEIVSTFTYSEQWAATCAYYGVNV